jgi:hypothetical protein
MNPLSSFTNLLSIKIMFKENISENDGISKL